MKLRKYQERSVQKCIDYVNSKDKRPGVVVAPTAAGKSLIIAEVARRSNRPVLVLQPSKELLEQNYDKFIGFGGTATVYSASAGSKDISIKTYATLGSIKSIAEKFKKLGVELVLIDECHYKFPPDPGKMFRKFMSKLSPKKVIGFTASPFRLKSMGTVFDSYSQLCMLNRTRPKYFKHFIDVVQIQELTSNGYWSELRYSEHEFDDTGLLLNSNGSEFTEDSVREVMKAQGVNNNIYLRIKELQKEKSRSILAFTDCVETAKILADRLDNAEYICGNTPKKERTRIVKDFKAGKIQVLLNFGVFIVGFDYPELSTIVMGRPTNSLAVWYQIVGRGVRVHENKEYCLVEDFCGNIDRFGKIEDLVVEDYPGYGWGVFSGERLLTGVRMDGLPITKKQINKESNCSKMWYGKYKGTKIDELPIWYLKYQLEWISSLKKPSKKLKVLKKAINKLI